MKRIILLLTTICMAVAGHAAQDYVPMVQEGKQWLYGRGDWGQYTGPFFSYLLEGDTLIGDKAYIKMFKQTEGIAGRTYYAALRETDCRVYAVMSGQDSEGLVYDYNLIQEGCTSEYENGDEATSLGVLWTARGSDGLPHRFFCVHITNPNRGLMPTGGPIWVEGVGHIDEGYDLLDARGYHRYCFEFLACYLNGKCVFSEEDYFNIIDPSSITLPTARESHTPLYDLQGRPVARPAKGIYIQDGRKRVMR